MNIAIILSGGTGSRMSENIPKQYLPVKGKLVIEYCMNTLFSCDRIDYVQIVAADEWQSSIDTVIPSGYKGKFRGFSRPGETRQLSIYNALQDIKKYGNADANVIIHDAARPFVKTETIYALLDALSDAEGSIPVLPMKDTVYMVEEDRITSLLERKSIFAGQAPEAFKFGKYLTANETLIPDKIKMINGSSEVAYLAGMNIKCIPGDENNYKITTRDDLRRWENESL